MKNITDYSWTKEKYFNFRDIIFSILEDMNKYGLNLAEAELDLIHKLNDVMYDYEMTGSFNREYTEILIQKRRYGYKTCLDGMLFWKGRFSNRTAQTVIGWRVLQELLASLDTEDFSEENRQITFFD